MKRVKIMLSAILVLALAAGTVAFNTTKAGGVCLYKIHPVSGKCALVPNVRYITDQGTEIQNVKTVATNDIDNDGIFCETPEVAATTYVAADCSLTFTTTVE
ncbi:hypothetical protein [Paraflavitalea sp. CAU 1676]|uniref:hypothetical protein n=1 Tax=Paraflavitalea sp. CAU 1676 TaxID=3032598 RepID=UPI0023DB3678|nr:hypothetical protein [Paraflavitalea sp. CAU 1676]MDF2192604.1 hypothetical protein [Paraflavitalea sp. CAU 1676]